MCVRMLRREGSRAGIASNFAIIHDADQRTVIREILTDTDRPTGCLRSARQFCGPAWTEVEATAHGVLDLLEELLERLVEEPTRVLYACQLQSSGWWGAPGFEDRLRASFAHHRPDVSSKEVDALVARPEQMSEQMFRDVVFYKM